MELEQVGKNIFRAIGACPYLCPIPVVMLGCADPARDAKPNLITVAWAGIVCSKPPMLSVSIRKSRLSHALISATGEFTVNLISEDLCRAADDCGLKSGRETDKFARWGLTPIPAPPLSTAPAVAEAPAFASCRVRSVTELGSHDLFIADILEVHVAERFFTKAGAIDERRMRLVSYVHGQYRALSEELGFFGYSAASGEALKRRAKERGK